MKDFDDILEILTHQDENSLGYGLKQEGIFSLRDAGRGVIALPEGPVKQLHIVLEQLIQKNGSATTNERIRIRCIGALGLIHRRRGTKVSGELQEICKWLFGIALSTTQELTPLVSKRAGFVLEADRIVGG